MCVCVCEGKKYYNGEKNVAKALVLSPYTMIRARGEYTTHSSSRGVKLLQRRGANLALLTWLRKS